MLAAIARLKKYKKLTPIEKGVLLDTLCALEGQGGGFYADLKFTIPLTTSQIADLLGWGEDAWEQFKNDMVQGKIFKEHNGSIYCPAMTQVSADSMSDEARDISLEILAHWNSKKIVVHKETPELLRNIVKYIRKRDYTLGQVKDAIDNYATILAGSEYFWTKKWNLSDFLSRGVERFQSEKDPFESFRINKKFSGKASGPSIMAPREVSPFPTEDEI